MKLSGARGQLSLGPISASNHSRALERVALLAGLTDAVAADLLAITATLVDVAPLAVEQAIAAEEAVGDASALALGLVVAAGALWAMRVGMLVDMVALTEKSSPLTSASV